LQVDLSATLFEEAGADKSRRAARTEFKPADLFRHTAVRYGLADAIRDGIVKRPVLERREGAQQADRRARAQLSATGQPNAWEKYRNLLLTGIERWKKVRDQLEGEGDKRKPILFVLCNDKAEAREVANYLTYGEATKDDLSGQPAQPATATARQDAAVSSRRGRRGGSLDGGRDPHREKEEKNEAEWEKVRQR
jgi:type III restriction enzyme